MTNNSSLEILYQQNHRDKLEATQAFVGKGFAKCHTPRPHRLSQRIINFRIQGTSDQHDPLMKGSPVFGNVHRSPAANLQLSRLGSHQLIVYQKRDPPLDNCPAQTLLLDAQKKVCRTGCVKSSQMPNLHYKSACENFQHGSKLACSITS